MQTREQIIYQLLDIYPALIKARGFIFFGTLQSEPPYQISSYQSWRLVIEENEQYHQARKSIGYLLESLLEETNSASLHPHGYIKIDNSTIALQWTSSDIIETILDNIDKVSKLKAYYGLNG